MFKRILSSQKVKFYIFIKLDVYKSKKGSKQKQTTIDQEDAANPAKTDEFAVKLLYFLKDFTQVTIYYQFLTTSYKKIVI